MGKPFAKELEKVVDTLRWAFEQEVDYIKDEFLYNKKPLFVVGSGGSLSACHYAALLYQQCGIMAKPITPLDLYYSKYALRQSNILFISASGKNTDILFGYETAVSFEPNYIYSLCMQENSPLGKLSLKNSISKNFEFTLPTGKDGFLATNSLIAFFGVLFKVFNNQKLIPIEEFKPNNTFIEDINKFLIKVTPAFTFTILYAGWGQPVAIDIESKLAEAALGNVLLSDYRNFGHGRHHWFDKRKENSAIIALITPDEESIAEKTLALLPSEIPILRIRSNHNSALASIDLLIKSFYFIEKLGKIQAIDPGRPGVPDFGSKLYNLKYKKLYNKSSDYITENEKIAIVRKANIPSFDHLSEKDKNYWHDSLKKFKKKFSETEFGTIIFDYDGTLCSAINRYNGLERDVFDLLNIILSKGFILGIATGRGKSVREDLEKCIPDEYHKQVVIGYYNCSDIGLLSERDLPNKNLPENSSLRKIYNVIANYTFPVEVIPELKPSQLTIEIKDKADWLKVRSSIVQLIMNENIPNIGILESSHSMDVIDHSGTSKLNITKLCANLAESSNLPSSFIAIGDKGQWPGNDYQLLSSPFSLSVDEVSSLTNTCWNLAGPGIKNIQATLYYLSCLVLGNKQFKINFG